MGTLAIVLALAFVEQHSGWDYIVFWTAGRTLLRGGNPYDPAGFYQVEVLDVPTLSLLENTRQQASTTTINMPFMNPPTFFPLAAALGLLSQRASEAVWLVLSFGGMLLLVPISLRILEAGNESLHRETTIGPDTRMLLQATVALSIASFLGLREGQLCVLTSLAVLGALLAYERRRFALAGICLAIGTVKTATLLPFLLLFPRPKTDWVVWLVLFLTVILLSLAVVSPDRLPGLIRDNLRVVTEIGREGGPNDYTHQSTSFDLVGLDRLFYCVGLRDRMVVRIAQISTLVLLSLFLARDIVKEAIDRRAAYAVIACLSTIFLYHRLADTVILALPLAYVAIQLRQGRKTRRIPLFLAATALVCAMQGSGGLLRELFLRTRGWWVLHRSVEVLVLPVSTWLIVFAMVVLWWDAHHRASGIPE